MIDRKKCYLFYLEGIGNNFYEINIFIKVIIERLEFIVFWVRIFFFS